MEDFLGAALGLPRPWNVQRMDHIEKREFFEVHIIHSGKVKRGFRILACPLQPSPA